MFDTMTLTKAVGAICAAFLVLLFGEWGAETLYHVGGHGKHEEQAYAIETGEEEVVEEVVEVDFAEVYAAADAGRGERLWRQCSACHRLEDGANGTGPHLWGVVGRDKGAVGDYSYSSAMAEAPGDWTPENLQAFLENPRDYIDGTKMAYSGMRDVNDRANLIAYLATFQ